MSGSPPLADGPAGRELARRFHQHVLADVDYLKSRGYNPTHFLGMIAQSGNAAAVAKRLFSDPRHTPYGFERLRDIGEPGRSVEFIANLPWFRSLFTEDEPGEAQSRLTLHDFPVGQRLTAGRRLLQLDGISGDSWRQSATGKLHLKSVESLVHTYRSAKGPRVPAAARAAQGRIASRWHAGDGGVRRKKIHRVVGRR